MKDIISIIFIALGGFVYAQKSQILLEGIVQDLQKNPINLANISLLKMNDSTLVSGSSSNDQGYFRFENLKQQDYLLKVSHISFETEWLELKNINLNSSFNKTIILKSKANQLDEVLFAVKKKLFEKRKDRTIINVSDDLINSSQIDLVEMIKKLPGIWIGQQNNILLNGQEKVQVTINGKTQYLSNAEILQRIKSIPTNTVDKIEIITTPGAKYDAEGSAILNIDTSFKIKSGLNLSINSLAGSSIGYNEFNPRSRNGFNISKGGDRINITANYNFTYNESLRNIEEKIDFSESSLNQFIDVRSEPERNHAFNLGLDYTINPKQSISVFYSFSDIKENVTQKNSISFIDQSNNNTEIFSTAFENIKSNQDALNFNYDVKIDSINKLNYSSDLIWSDKSQNSNYLNESNQSEDEILRNISFSDIFVLVNQIDYTKSSKNGSVFDAGVKYSIINTENALNFETFENGAFELDENLSNAFEYDENIIAGYFDLAFNWKKSNLQMGLRYEKAEISGVSPINQFSFKRTFEGFFPNLSYSYNIDDSWQITAAYNRRISRPDYTDINPFIYYINPFTQIEGNPGLIPSITNKFQSNLVYNRMYSLKVTYYKTNDVFTIAQFQDIDSGEQKLVPTNIGDLSNFDINIGLPLQYKEWWEGYFDLTLLHQRYIENTNTNLGFNSNSQTTFQLFNQNTFKLPSNYNFEITQTLVTPSVQGQFSFSTIYFLSFGAQKSFFNDRFEIKFIINDALKTLKYKGQLIGPGWLSNYSDFNDSRQINISLKYDLIKRGKVSTKKPKWISEDEKKRI